MFQVPSESPEPPSTPPQSNIFANDNPSTTPAGPPPESSFSHVSTTPAGPPPKSVYGSSVAFTHTSQPRGNVFDSAGDSLAYHQDDEIDYFMEDDYELTGAGSLQRSSRSIARALPQKSEYHDLARSFSAEPASLFESDELILQTEDVLETLFHQSKIPSTSPQSSQHNVVAAVRSLGEMWTSLADQESYTSVIGPEESSPPLIKASFLANLMLNLRHPGPGDSRRSTGGIRVTKEERPIPEVLQNWLLANHPSSSAHAKVMGTAPNPTASKRFWDSILTSAVRGELTKCIDLLRAADFSHAISARDDGEQSNGYHGLLLSNIERVVDAAINVLSEAPALKKGSNWDVTGSEWTLYRYKVEKALAELEQFAEGAGNDHLLLTESSHQDSLSLSTMSRKAKSRVPWTVYENLKFLYSQILGVQDDVLAAASDWLEAAICCAIWWDGSEEDDMGASLAKSRRTRRQSHTARQVDVQPQVAYQQRMAQALYAFTENLEEGDEGPNPRNAVEVGLACIFDGDVEGVVRIIRHWSVTVADAVVEIASQGNWLGEMQIPTDQVMGGFDEQDLLVLSYAKQSPKALKKDEILAQYAEVLATRNELKSPSGMSREGWQLAIQVLGRLDNHRASTTRIAELLGHLNFTSAKPVEQAMGLCNKLGLEQDAYKLSERYADHLLRETSSFGDAIVHFARARQSQKLKDTLNMLVSYSLVQSAAYPEATSLDPTLQELISKPTQLISRVRRADPEAARLIEVHASGYATIRRFYEIRDEDVSSSTAKSSQKQQEAAAALIAAIQSASDSIHGGLLAPEVESVLEVDGLLALLCEALVFLNDDSILSQQQIFTLLKAIEDLDLAPQEIWERCESCARSAVANAWGSEVPDPKKLMIKKSTSSLSSSSFSLINSAVLESGSTLSSGVLVTKEIKRAWDWRKGFGRRVKTEDMMGVIRLGLARAVGRAWLGMDTSS